MKRAYIGTAMVCMALCSLSGGTALPLFAAEPTVEIQIDLRPFFPRPEFSQALLVRLQEDGKTRAVNYAPNLLSVLEVRESILTKDEAERLITRTQHPTFRQALGRNAFSGIPHDGDPFVLLLKSKGGALHECDGILQDAPESMQNVVEEMIGMWKRLEKKPLDEAYLRSESLNSERFAQLRKEGKVKFVQLQDVSSEVRPIVSTSLNRPLDFVGLNENDQRMLEKSGKQFYLQNESNAYLLTLFPTRK